MWTSRRRAVALLQGAAFLTLPFLLVRGESAFRFDIPSLRLHFFGHVLWIDEFYLFLLGLLFLGILTIAVTVVLGRVWCGLLCPQTVIAELAEWSAAVLPKRPRPSARAVILLPLSALVSLSLIGYFVPPAEAARISIEQVRISVKIPPEHVGKGYGTVRSFGSLDREEWQCDGTWIGIVKLPAGMQTDFYDRINTLTKGNVKTKILK